MSFSFQKMIFMYYYSTDIHINMLHVAVFVTVFSTLGAVIDTALSVTSSVYEVWTHKKQPDSERTYFFRLSGWKRNYRNNCKYAAFLLILEALFCYLPMFRHSNITWKLFLNSKFSFSGCCNHAVWGDCLPFYSTGINQMCDSPNSPCCI